MSGTSVLQFFALCLVCLCVFCFNTTSSFQPATLSYSVNRQDNMCVLAVELNCTIHGLTSINWFFDGRQISTYTYHERHIFPYSVVHDVPGVEITITRAMPYSQMSDFFDGTSILTTSTSVLNMQNIGSLQCGTYTKRSQRISRATLEFNVLSPPPNISSCALVLNPGAAAISLLWSPSFTAQHSVERYRVSVSPDPSSCSSDQVSVPSEDYHCSGLALGEIYNFTVSAINCGGREGHPRTFTAAYGLVPPSIVDVSALYIGSSLSYSLEEIQVVLKYTEPDAGVVIQGELQCIVNVSRIWTSIVVSVEDSSGNRLLNEFSGNSSSCDKFEHVCTVRILVPQVTGDSYCLASSAVDTSGYTTPFQLYPHYLNGSLLNLLNYTLIKSGDAIFAICSVRIESVTSCSVQYTQNHRYKNLSRSVTGPNNIPFLVTTIDSLTETDNIILYHQASIVIHPSLQIIVRDTDVLIIRQSMANETNSPEEANRLEVYLFSLLGTPFLLLLLICSGVLVFLCYKVKKAPTESIYECTLPPHEGTSAELEAKKYIEVDYGTADAERKELEVVYEEIASTKTPDLHSEGNSDLQPESNSIQRMTYNHAYHTAKFDFS